MSETLRKFLCRCGFFLFCLVPTAMVGWWIISPVDQTAWEAELSKTTGFKIEVSSISRTRPGSFRIENIKIIDNELGQIASLGVTDVAFDSGKPRTAVSHAEVSKRHFTQLLNRLIDQSLRHRQVSLNELEIYFGRLTLTSRSTFEPKLPGNSPSNLPNDNDASSLSPSGGQTFEFVNCSFKQDEKTSQLSVQFRLAGQTIQQPQKLTITRRLEPEGATSTHWTLDTCDASLPCEIMVALIPEFSICGSEAEFTGRMIGKTNQDGWDLELVGELAQVDLRELVTQRFPHTIDGRAKIVLNRCQFRQGRLVEIAGEINCESGSIGASLLEAVSQHFNCPLTRTPQVNEFFNELALGFRLDPKEISLQGLGNNNAILLDRLGVPLLKSDDSAPVSTLELMRTLVPQSDVQVPFTKELATMVNWFPAPAIERASDPENRRRANVTVRISD